jgi:DNA-binding LacI/PurR family transcriptional regulator
MPTIKDVAERAGVSIATVSHVINNSAPVREATRRRVMRAIQELRYRPSVRGRNLQAQESRIIGYQWYESPDLNMNPVLDRFLYGVSQKAKRQGYYLILFNTDRDADVIHTYEDLIHTDRVDGFVLANTDQDDRRIRYLLDVGFPFASFGRSNPEWDFPWVDVDGESGVRQVMAHLRRNGHRRIAAICWPRGSLAGDARMKGYFESMREAGLEIDPAWVVRGMNLVRTGFEAVSHWLALPPGRRPTAVVAASDVLAIGVMSGYNAAGIRVGREVAVVGFDDAPTAAFLSPPLSSVRQPVDQIGEMVFDMLLRAIRGERSGAQQVLLQPQLIVRASSDFVFSG